MKNQKIGVNHSVEKGSASNGRTAEQRRSVREIVLYACNNINIQNKNRLAQALSSPVNWRNLLYLTEFHGVTPLVAHNLISQGFSAKIPEEYLVRLKNELKNTLFKNMLISNQLVKILATFRQNGINIIPLKGVVLTEELFKNLGVRSISDIDVLVPYSEVERARMLLFKSGYIETDQEYLRDHPFHGISYCKETGASVALELHWNLEDPRVVEFPLLQIWKRAGRIRYQDHSVSCLSSEDNLIFLAVHLLRSEYHQLKAMVDIAELLKKYQDLLDWEYITKSARDWQVEPAIYYVLRRARELLDAPVSDSALERLRPENWRWYLLDRLLSCESFVIPIENTRLRNETLSFLRSFTMGNTQRMLAAIYRHRESNRPLDWLKTCYWAVPVLTASLLRRN